MQWADSDFAKQAHVAAGQVGRVAQQGARNAQEGFSRFVEGPRDNNGYQQAPMDDSKKDFWDSFSSLADQQQQKPANSSAIGTAAMGKGRAGASAPPPQKKDDWEEW